MTSSGGPAADTRHAGAQKVYFVCFTDPDGATVDEIRAVLPEHKAWVVEQESAGHLVMAGPFLTDEHVYSGTGMLIVRASSAQEASDFMSADPMHASGLRRFRIVPWQVNEGTLDVRLTLSTGRHDLG